MTLLKSWWRWMLLCLACVDGWHLLFVQQELWLMPALLHSEMVPLALEGRRGEILNFMALKHCYGK